MKTITGYDTTVTPKVQAEVRLKHGTDTTANPIDAIGEVTWEAGVYNSNPADKSSSMAAGTMNFTMLRAADATGYTAAPFRAGQTAIQGVREGDYAEGYLNWDSGTLNKVPVFKGVVDSVSASALDDQTVTVEAINLIDNLDQTFSCRAYAEIPTVGERTWFGEITENLGGFASDPELFSTPSNTQRWMKKWNSNTWVDVLPSGMGHVGIGMPLIWGLRKAGYGDVAPMVPGQTVFSVPGGAFQPCIEPEVGGYITHVDSTNNAWDVYYAMTFQGWDRIVPTWSAQPSYMFNFRMARYAQVSFQELGYATPANPTNYYNRELFRVTGNTPGSTTNNTDGTYTLNTFTSTSSMYTATLTGVDTSKTYRPLFVELWKDPKNGTQARLRGFDKNGAVINSNIIPIGNTWDQNGPVANGTPSKFPPVAGYMPSASNSDEFRIRHVMVRKADSTLTAFDGMAVEVRQADPVAQMKRWAFPATTLKISSDLVTELRTFGRVPAHHAVPIRDILTKFCQATQSSFWFSSDGTLNISSAQTMSTTPSGSAAFVKGTTDIAARSFGWKKTLSEIVTTINIKGLISTFTPNQVNKATGGDGTVSSGAFQNYTIGTGSAQSSNDSGGVLYYPFTPPSKQDWIFPSVCTSTNSTAEGIVLVKPYDSSKPTPPNQRVVTDGIDSLYVKYDGGFDAAYTDPYTNQPVGLPLIRACGVVDWSEATIPFSLTGNKTYIDLWPKPIDVVNNPPWSRDATTNGTAWSGGTAYSQAAPAVLDNNLPMFLNFGTETVDSDWIFFQMSGPFKQAVANYLMDSTNRAAKTSEIPLVRVAPDPRMELGDDIQLVVSETGEVLTRGRITGMKLVMGDGVCEQYIKITPYIYNSSGQAL